MPSPDMVPVDSTSVESVGYDPENRELYVRFLTGGTYVYSGVPRTTHQELLAAESVGAYVNRQIKPYFDFRQV